MTEMMTRGKVMVTYTPSSDRYVITSAYDQELVEILKSIDHQCREYDVNTKQWFVDTWAVEFLTPRMESEGFCVQVVGGPFAHTVTSQRCTSIQELHDWLCAMPDAHADTAEWKKFARSGCALGLRLLLLEPTGTEPVDVRSPQQRRRDDGAAQDEARAAGRSDWDKAKSKGGVDLATSDETLITRHIHRYRDKYGADCPVNLAVAH